MSNRPYTHTRFSSGVYLALSFLAFIVCFGLFAAPAQAQDAKPLRLFGYVEFKGPLKNIPAWTSVLERNSKSPLFIAGARLNSSTDWEAFKTRLEGQSFMDQLRTVNRFWNQWPYRLDQEVWGKPDYWAIPDEFRRKSGDCEDYAIAKYLTLREMGVPAEKMRIAVVMETVRNIAHAVLVVFEGDDAWVLDNLSNSVLSHTRLRSYEPQFSVNENNRWAHVRPK